MDLKLHKVAALPWTLEKNSMYVVKSGQFFDVYVTNDTWTIVAYQLEKEDKSTWLSMLWGADDIPTWFKWMRRMDISWTFNWYRIDSFASDWTAISWDITISVSKNWTPMGDVVLSAASTDIESDLSWAWRTGLSFVKDDKITYNVTSNTGCKNIILTLYYS